MLLSQLVIKVESGTFVEHRYVLPEAQQRGRVYSPVEGRSERPESRRINAALATANQARGHRNPLSHWQHLCSEAPLSFYGRTTEKGASHCYLRLLFAEIYDGLQQP